MLLRLVRGRAIFHALASLSLLAPSIACHSASDRSQTIVQRAPDKDDVVENTSASVKTSALRAALHGSEVELSFTISKRQEKPLAGKLSVKLLDAANRTEPTLGYAETAIRQAESEKVHTLTLSGLPGELERPKTAPLIVAWSVTVPGGELHGRKSLYAALGKLEVEVRGATDVPDNGEAPFRVIVRDPDTLAPVEGASVRATLVPSGAAEGSLPLELFLGLTDPRGELATHLALPIGVEGGSMRIDVKAGSAESWTRAAVRALHERKISLSTDKTIYKPGQTIELRTLSIHTGDKTPLAAEEVTFEALDGKGNKVFKKRVTTDAFGVAFVSVPTASEVNEGSWTIRASTDGARAEKRLPVVRYNLPKLKVGVSSTREYAIAGQAIHGRVEARYLFGMPVTGGAVTLALKLAGQGTLLQTSGQTDQEGIMSFEVTVPSGAGGSRLEDGRLTLSLEAEVTDSAGQKETGSSSLPLTKGTLVVKAIAEAGALVPGVENLIYLVVSDPVGRPVQASVAIDGLGPIDPLQAGADGVAELRFVPPSGSKSVTLGVTATDGAGRSFQRALKLDESEDGVILVRTDHAVYEAGDVASVSVITTAPAGRAYVDVYQGASGVESRAIELQNGRGSFLLPITNAMKGLLVLDAFTLAGSGKVVRGSQRIMVDPKDRLNIRLVSDQATYLPGHDASVTVQVTDALGRPQVAALGLTAVDEASFALGGEPDSDLRMFFDLDRAALPNDLNVLGRSGADLVGAADLKSEERLARLLFASARGIAGPGLDYNSIREEMPQVRAAVEPRVKRDAIKFFKDLIPMVHGVALTRDIAKPLIERRARQAFDPFGHAYDVRIGDDANWQQATFRSAGPDEVFDTPDDVSVQLWYGWVTWAEKSQIDDENGFGVQHGVPGGGPAAMGGGVRDAADHAGMPPAAPQNPAEQGPGEAKVRSDFRETVLVNPTLITDASGQAAISFPLADSITTWRVSAEGSTRDGKLGSARLGFNTFQEFFVDFDVPTSFTQGDTVELSAIVYNYLSTPQAVTVALEASSWLDLLSSPTQTVMLSPSEVRAVPFRVRAARAGTHTLTLRGSAGQVADALQREARVVPNGVRDDQSISDKLNGAREHVVTIPANAIEGGTKVALVLTPGFAADAVRGTEALLREPGGCFEQTTSTAWPNTMVTKYLQTTGQLTPDLRDKAFGLVTRGYQRLLRFESPTGGFNWWGNSDPGNRILSAIMLWHMKDMESIVEVDGAVRDRTLRWLLAQQKDDGSWASGDALHAGNEVLGTSVVRTTAFIAWALAHTELAPAAVQKAAGYLALNPPPATDLYANALAANALVAIDPAGQATASLFQRLDGLKQDAGEGRLKWPTDAPSWTGARGDAAAIETTSLVAYGLMRGQVFPENAAGAVRFLVANKDAVGSWYNTQATMNALRALLSAASPRGPDAEGTLSVMVNGRAIPPIAITRQDGDVYREFDLTELVHSGDNRIQLEMVGSGEVTYQIARQAYKPRTPPAPGSLDLSVAYDTTSPVIGQAVRARVLATYRGQGTQDQVMVRVGRAPGFAPRTEDLEQLVQSHKIARYEIGERDVALYLMGFTQGETRDLSMRMSPSLAFDGVAPASAIYAYYEPTVRTEAPPIALHVSARR